MKTKCFGESFCFGIQNGIIHHPIPFQTITPAFIFILSPSKSYGKKREYLRLEDSVYLIQNPDSSVFLQVSNNESSYVNFSGIFYLLI